MHASVDDEIMVLHTCDPAFLLHEQPAYTSKATCLQAEPQGQYWSRVIFSALAMLHCLISMLPVSSSR